MKSLKTWQKVVLGAVIFMILAGIGYFLYLRSFRNKPSQNPTPNNPPTTQTPSTPTPSQPTTPTPAVTLFYPITNYNLRVTFRYYGLYVTPAQQAQPCGAPFTGYHTGDDLETTTAEKNIPVPVYAIAGGTVREVGTVSGYGGLIVLGTNINGSDYTIYYGHINLSSTGLRTGDSVSAGQKLANLGAECSIQTDGERKHLHFAIHKGTAINIRGYVPSLSELSAWINPKEFLMQTGAKAI